MFNGGSVSFYEAEYIGGDVSFNDSIYSPDCSILWGPFKPRQPGLRYKRWSGDRTNRPCNSAVTPVFRLGGCGASRHPWCCDQWIAAAARGRLST
jgi:hypothetical protein